MYDYVIVMLLVSTSGCATITLSETYEALPPITSSPAIDDLYVVKAVEDRPGEGRSKILPGFWIFLPFVPYGHQEFTPERYQKNRFLRNHDFLDDVTDTVVKDLSASGVARAVIAIENEDSIPALDPDDAVLRLRLEEGIWHRKLTTYGLSIYGAYAWLVAPISFGHIDLGIAAQLEDSHGRILGEQSFDGSEKVTEWAYAIDPLLKRLPVAYGQISPGLRQLVFDSDEATSPIQQASHELPAEHE